MEKTRIKSLLMAVAFVAAIGLFGTPAAPGTSIVPTVGGTAGAYAPTCTQEYLVMQQAWDEYYTFGGFWAYMDYLRAARDFFVCMQG